jgi:hypothetical protein
MVRIDIGNSEVLSDFPQSVNANAGVVPQLGYDSSFQLLPNSSVMLAFVVT